jgi:hypothetical protein
VMMRRNSIFMLKSFKICSKYIHNLCKLHCKRVPLHKQLSSVMCERVINSIIIYFFDPSLSTRYTYPIIITFMYTRWYLNLAFHFVRLFFIDDFNYLRIKAIWKTLNYLVLYVYLSKSANLFTCLYTHS